MRPSPDPRSGDAPSVVLARATGLLTLTLASLGLAGWLLQFGRRMFRYVAHNESGSVDRDGAMLILAGALVIAVGGSLAARFRWRVSEARLYEVARRLSPLAFAGPIVTLMDWRPWHLRPLVFLVLVVLVALGFEYSIRVAAAQPPLFPRAALAARLRGLRATAGDRTRRLLGHLPLGIVVVGAVSYAAYFGYHTVIHHLNGHSNAWDLGVLENLQYNLLHGAQLFKSSPVYGPEGTHLARHATFFAFVITPFYAIAQRPETLLIIQAVLVGAGALPLFAFGRRQIGAWPACAMALAYLLYAPLHGSNLFDFHYLTMVPVFIFGVAWAFDSRRDRLAWLLVLLTLSIREDVAAALAVLGVYLFLSGTRPRSGFAVAALGLSYFLVMKLAIMPEEDGAATFLDAYRGLMPADDQSVAGIGKTILGNPMYAAGTLLTELKLIYALQILAPVLLLPIRRWITALLLLPGLAFTLLATDYMGNAPVAISFQYTAFWTPFVFLGTVVVLRTLRQPRQAGDLLGPVRMGAALAGLALALLATSTVFGAVLQRHTAMSAFRKFPFRTTAEDLEHRRIRRELLNLIPPDAKVAASEQLVPHVSNRPDAYSIRMGIHDAEYVFFRFGHPDCHGRDRPVILQLLREREYGVVKVEEPFALLKRGHSTAQNRRLLRMVDETDE